jgi:plastocyanin
MIKQLQKSEATRRGVGVLLAFLVAAAMWVVGTQGAAAATVAIDAKGFAFTPQEITVKVGDTVTWTNGDNESHAVEGGSLSSPEIRPGETYARTFTAPEEIAYNCRFHTYMTGTIHVLAAGSATPTTAPPTTVVATTAPPTTVATTDSTEAPAAPVATAPTPTRSSAFQDVPDDPSARQPPGAITAAPSSSSASGGTGSSSSPSATTSPPTTVAPTHTTSPPQFQDVPDDPSGGHPPADLVAQSTTGSDPASGAPAAATPAAAGTPLGDGMVLAPYSKVGSVKEFHLTMAETTVEVTPGVTKPAYAFNGVVPGPVLRVNEGDRIRIVVQNDLKFPTSVHWHGMILPNDQDGVAGITQPHIEPGAKYVYEYTAVATGTHWYHAHSSGRHIGKGLYGMLEVVPKKGNIEADHDYSLMLGDTDLGFTINGRSFPSTPTLETQVGETVHLRVVNTGDQVHAFHLHGVPFKVLAQDGIRRNSVESMDTLTIAPGQTYDLLFAEQYPGKWVLHCHMFVHSHDTADTHADGMSGMNGMTLIVNVAPKSASNSSGSVLPGVADQQLGVTAVGLGGISAALARRRRRLSHPPIQES